MSEDMFTMLEWLISDPDPTPKTPEEIASTTPWSRDRVRAALAAGRGYLFVEVDGRWRARTVQDSEQEELDAAAIAALPPLTDDDRKFFERELEKAKADRDAMFREAIYVPPPKR